MALWLLPKRRFLCVGAKANVPLCGGKKMNKKCAVGKKKKYTRVSKECRLTRCPVSIWSVFVCLSVKMVYFSCPSVRYCQVARSSVTLAANGFGLCVRAGFLALPFIRNRKFKFSTNVHTKHVRPPDAKPVLAAYPSACQVSLLMLQILSFSVIYKLKNSKNVMCFV